MQAATKRRTDLMHASAVDRCRRDLESLGIQVQPADARRDHHDLLVQEKVRVVVRYATAHIAKQHTYRRRNGELVRYAYKSWNVNFHRHGRLRDRYCDFFVCYLAGAGTHISADSSTALFVIPWEAVTGLTFTLTRGAESRRPYDGHYAPYGDRLDLIAEAAQRAVA